MSEGDDKGLSPDEVARSGAVVTVTACWALAERFAADSARPEMAGFAVAVHKALGLLGGGWANELGDPVLDLGLSEELVAYQ